MKLPDRRQMWFPGVKEIWAGSAEIAPDTSRGSGEAFDEFRPAVSQYVASTVDLD